MVRGQVVEVRNGKKISVPNVKVSVAGESEDVTKTDGSFTLYLPPDKEYITIELEGCPHPIISPYGRLVNIPPPDFLEVKVCAKENQKLREKVDELNKKLKDIQRKHRLTKRQMAEMHEQMLDKILVLQEEVEGLKKEVESAGEALEAANEKIAEHEKRNAELEQELLEALEERYLRQQEYQLEVSSSMEDYLIKLKDLRDWLTHFDDYFLGRGAQQDFNNRNSAYGKAFEKLNDNHANYLMNIRNYWESQLLETEAKELFQLALEDIHDRIIIQQYNRLVIRKLQQYSSQPHSGKLRKEAKKGAAEVLLLLNAAIPDLEDRNRKFNRQMINNT